MDDEFDIDNLKFHEEVGEGGFGTVNRVTFKKPYKGFTEAAAKSIWSLRDEEVEIMRKLSHPHIVIFLAFYVNGPLNMIILEYASKGSLHDYISDQSKPLPEDLMRKWMKESALAIQYLHGCNVLHRDIKTKNCLLFEDDLLKLCDFGLAREIESSQSTSTQRGTCRYMAPEIHKGNERGRAIYSKPSDIYAYGMLILEISTRKPPFEELEWQAIVLRVGGGEKPTIPIECPQQLSQIMQRCWDINPKKRPTIEGIILALTGGTLPEDQSEPLWTEASEGVWTLVKEFSPKYKGETLGAWHIACFPNGEIIMTSYGLGRTDELDKQQLFSLGSDGECKLILKAPEDEQKVEVSRVAVSSQGQIVIIENVNKPKVKMFDQNGKYLRCFSTLTSKNDPSTKVSLQCIAIHRGKHILVGDSERHVITIHTLSTGELTKKIVFNIILDGSMVVNNAKQILHHFRPAASKCTKVVGKDNSGKDTFAFSPKISEDMTGELARAGGIACDAHDNIFLALSTSAHQQDKNTGHIHKYSPTGTFITCVVKGLDYPSDLVFMSNGSLVVAVLNSVLIYSLR